MAQESSVGKSMDIDIGELNSRPHKPFASPGHSHVYEYEKRFAVKIISWDGELEMMKKAGDCSITPRGRVFKGGKQVGIIMDLGKPVDVTVL